MSIWQKPSIPKFFNRDSTIHKTTLLLLLAAVLFVVSMLSICYGSVPLRISEFFEALGQGDTGSKVYKIIAYVRLPRTFAGLLAGSAFAVSGVILQAVLHNPLAGPNIIGINAGSGLFAMIVMSLFPAALPFVPLAAFVGALFASLLIYFIAAGTGASKITIVLAGVAVSSFLSAGIDTLVTLYPDTAVSANTFMIGGFSGVTMKSLSFAMWYIAAGLVLAVLLSHDMNILCLGEETATSLGLNVKGYRFVLIVVASVLAGGAVSFAGLLGFVGLIVPHGARMMFGSDNRLLLPASALLGGVFVVGCDLLARVLFAPFEIPVGIIMSFLGGPFFIYLLLNQRRMRTHD